MALIDLLIVLAYCVGIYFIVYHAKKDINQLKRKNPLLSGPDIKFMAGRSATIWEASFSIVATEFSALTFVQFPTLIIMGAKGLLWGMIGIVIGRWVISRFLLKDFYRSGLTVFEALSRGVKDYQEISASAMLGRKIIALVYFFTKLLAISGGLYYGVYFASLFFGESSFVFVLISVVVVTTAYNVAGGLKAVMRANIFQFCMICCSGVTLLGHAIYNFNGDNYSLTLHRFMDVSFGAPGIKHILVGILIGFLTDFSTHGVEQEFVQKLKACKRPKSAIQAVMLSNILTVILQIIFILIGIVYSDILPKELGELNDSIEKFMFACRDTIPTGLKGIFVVGIISAAMSTLDSSLNALSSILWNDIILAKDNHRFSFYVKMDNIVIAVFVCIFVYFISNNPFYLNSFVNFNSFILYPIICTFLLRFVLNRFVSFEFSLHSFAFVSLGCVLGFVMNIFYLDLPVQTAVIPSLIISALIIRFYEFVKHWI